MLLLIRKCNLKVQVTTSFILKLGAKGYLTTYIFLNLFILKLNYLVQTYL